jgi:hypothetical protein
MKKRAVWHHPPLVGPAWVLHLMARLAGLHRTPLPVQALSVKARAAQIHASHCATAGLLAGESAADAGLRVEEGSTQPEFTSSIAS